MTNGQQLPFSARNRGSHRQIDGQFPPSGRVGLLHLLFDLARRGYVAGWPEVARELQRIGRFVPSDYGSSNSDKTRAQADSEEILTKLSWDRVYDFCERLHNYLAQEVGYHDDSFDYHVSKPRGDVQAFIASEIQGLFAEESLAFEFSDGLVRRRGRKHTVERVSRAETVLGDPRLVNARKHYDKALQFFRNPSKPDYENAVKEAVCAVEAAGKALFPESKAATLGDLTKWLVGADTVRMPKALAQTLTGVYGFRSGGEGIGHGGASGGVATVDVAEYILAICASQIIYLVDLANAQEVDIPF